VLHCLGATRFCCVLIEKNALRRTCRIELEAVEADFELAWREPPLELRAVHFCHDARVRPFAHPPMLFGVAVARWIDGHLLVLEIERSSFPQDPACPQAIGDAFHQPSGPQAAQDPLKEIRASRSTASRDPERTRQSPDLLTRRWRACVQERGMQMSAYGGRLFMVKAIFRASLELGELKAPSIFSRRSLARADPTQNQWDSTDWPVGRSACGSGPKTSTFPNASSCFQRS